MGRDAAAEISIHDNEPHKLYGFSLLFSSFAVLQQTFISPEKCPRGRDVPRMIETKKYPYLLLVRVSINDGGLARNRPVFFYIF